MVRQPVTQLLIQLDVESVVWAPSKSLLLIQMVDQSVRYLSTCLDSQQITQLLIQLVDQLVTYPVVWAAS
jgi:hypothetical protein